MGLNSRIGMNMKALKQVFGFVLLISIHLQLAAQSNQWLNILEEGGNNTGTICTQAIQKAINDAADSGGNTIYFPAGDYLTGAIHLKSNTAIYLEAGATLRFSDNFDDYLPFVQLRWEGTVMNSFSPLIYAKDAENVSILGRGTIDGQGKKWWLEMYRIETAKEKLEDTKYQQMWDEQNEGLETSPYYQRTMNLRFFRPPLIQTFNCKNVLIDGVTIQNSPFWTVNPAFCNNVTINGVTIFNPESPNTDGINPTSCKNVHISNCHISVGDDCITIKSGRDADGRKWAQATENVTITNCTMLNGHGGVVIGSEMSGGIKKVTISNCVFDGTDRGIRIKAARGRGGVVEDIRVNNIVMNNIQDQAIVFNLLYDKNTQVEPVTERTPIFRNIHISDVTGTNINKAGLLQGIEEMPISNVSFSNIRMEAQEGFEVNLANQVEFHDVAISSKIGASFKISNSNNLIFDNISSNMPLANTPIISLNNVKNAFIHSNFPMQPTPLFMEIEGEQTKNIVVRHNEFMNVSKIVKRAQNLKKNSIVED